MKDEKLEKILEIVIGAIDIPPSAYEKAKDRYESLGKWFNDEEKSESAKHKPDIHPQGSFRLGTVIRPLDDSDEYDLDLTCRLTEGVAKGTHSQKDLKELIGRDLENYRKSKGITTDLDEKPRCWTLHYLDGIGFHMDTVPAIPESQGKIDDLRDQIILNTGVDKTTAQWIAEYAVAITDYNRASYREISEDWEPSNPRGFARWFDYKVKMAKKAVSTILTNRAQAAIEDLPQHEWKLPLQRVVQLLKRHRNVKFKDNMKCAPISIVITTLAAHAYQGEETAGEALQGIVSRMRGMIRSQAPYVPNPTNFDEDFADKWDTDKGRRLRLKDHFYWWLDELERDIRLLSTDDPRRLSDKLLSGFGVHCSEQRLSEELGLELAEKIKSVQVQSTKPWAW